MWSLLVFIVIVILITFVFLFVYRFETYTNGENILVVYVYSDRCPHCVSFAPTWDKLVNIFSMNPKYEFVKIEKSDSDFMKYSQYVNAFPTVLMFDPNRVLIKKTVGNSSLDELENVLESV